MTGVIRGAVLNDPTCSWGSPPHEVTPADSSASVGSDRSVSAGRVVAGNPRRSFLVARPRSLRARRFSGAGVPSARVMVGRGLGGSLGRAVRFRPVGSGRRRALDQCTGALGDRECSQVVCSTSRRFLSDGLRRQIDSRVVSAEPRRDSFFFSELHRSEDSPLGGGSVCGDFPLVYYGETQCASGRFFSPKPDLGLRVDAEAGGLQGFMQEVAGVNRPVCNVLDHRCSLYFSPYHNHNGGSTDHRGSILASEAMVSGSSGSGGRRPSRSSTVQGPSASAPLPPVSSGSVQAVSSCLVTIKRFTRAGGFSRRVARQVSLARRPSSRAGYQSKWLVFRQWCRSEGHSISHPSLPKIADFLFWVRRYRRLSVSSVMG